MAAKKIRRPGRLKAVTFMALQKNGNVTSVRSSRTWSDERRRERCGQEVKFARHLVACHREMVARRGGRSTVNSRQFVTAGNYFGFGQC